ncbi:MAG TPA: NAD(P)-binding domain-containing protein [Chitinophagaceae bacterium]|jgi:8-hydroxy-5-deazaflavin:NADPH oxidoreductase|nr:NAD(P)-binding domain-containing protein [Chitinophagaceae bacterium]
MKVGILGSSVVGQALGKAFLAEGNEVMIGTRDTSKESLVKWQGSSPTAKLGSFADTAKFGELIVLAVSGDVAAKVIEQAGKENFSNKIVIDTTNPIAKAPPENGVLKFFTSLDRSLMEDLQKSLPDAKFVKAFNSVGNAVMYKPKFSGTKPTMFICGNDEAAKKTVTAILDSFGHETEDMGKVEAARAIEPLCILWCIPGFLRNQWNHAFKLLKK